MALARLLVTEGPDHGATFDIPLRGGRIGREPGSVVQLSDQAVSRAHCTLEFRNDALVLIDGGSRNRTVVNGEPISTHRLQSGDEIVIGRTRLTFLSEPRAGSSPPRPSLAGRVTVEVSSRELWQHRRDHALPNTASAAGGDATDRTHQRLIALAHLGDRLRQLDQREAVWQASCDSAREALGAERACVLIRDAAGRIIPRAGTVGDSAERSTQSDIATLSLDPELIAKVMAEDKAVALDLDASPAVAVPLYGAVGDAPVGLLYVDRPLRRPLQRPQPRTPGSAPAWDQLDVMIASCLAHVSSAALASLEAREALAIENQELSEKLGGREFIGQSTAAQAVLGFVAKVGPSDATVLLTGESGSGKEMVARAIHQASRRSRAPFIAINCAALTESLIESELFGHERGAFTGAGERKLGRFELADKGTLFLDEVGELPPNCQTKFLRVLEEQVFERVGGGRPIAVDVRVIAATNRDLPVMVQRGQFRDDLYYRLSVIHTIVPPLRQRPSDIPILAEHFVAKLRPQVARRVRGFTPEAMQALTHHSWPGNVRELRNAVERAIVLGDGAFIEPAHLPPDVLSGGQAPAARSSPAAYARPATPVAATSSPRAPTPPLVAATEPPPQPTNATPKPLRELEREGIIAALQATGGNKVQAAALLQIDRSTLYKKIKDYDITSD